MKYYVISGEASGDMHGANLIEQIKLNDAAANFRCWGGDKIKNAGGVIAKHYKELAFMGFFEVVKNLSTILSNFKFCYADILNYKPDLLILIDYPGFNLRVAEWAKKHNIKVVYYISPQIWAWKENRVHKIKKNVDLMISIIPFEKAFYKKHDFDIEYAGHPLLDEISKYKKSDALISEIGNSKKIIALLPGSRKQELNKMLPVMINVAQSYKDCQFVIAAAPSMDKAVYDEFLEGKGKDIKVVYGKTYDLLNISDAAIVTSGTATLETALFNVPQMCCYKGNAISIGIARMLVKIKYISLVNLISDKPVIKELIQDDMNEESIKTELQKILSDTEYKNTMLSEYTALKNMLGGIGASQRAAKMIDKFLTHKN